MFDLDAHVATLLATVLHEANAQILARLEEADKRLAELGVPSYASGSRRRSRGDPVWTTSVAVGSFLSTC
jgi:hypothetical protein